MPLFGANPRPPSDYYPTAPAWLAPALRATKLQAVFVRGVYAWRASARASVKLWRAVRRPIGYVALLSLLALTLVAAGVIGYRLWRVPAWVVNGSANYGDVVARIGTYRSAQAAILGVLVQAVGGLAIIAGLYVTWKQIRAGQEAQVSERYGRFVEQLASDRTEVRVGGIEGLERIAYDTPAEFVPILRMLSAFVVERSKAWQSGRTVHVPIQTERLPLDLQMAISVLQRFRDHPLRRRFQGSIAITGSDFHDVELGNIDFDGFDLSHSNFKGAQLVGAWLMDSNVSGCSFANGNLEEAHLISASVYHVSFKDANLSRAYLSSLQMSGGIDFSGANLSNADCEWSEFGGADFRGARLTGARFFGTTLGQSHLEGVDLSVTLGLQDSLSGGAHVDDATIMPGNDANAAAKGATGRRTNWRPLKRRDGSILYDDKA